MKHTAPLSSALFLLLASSVVFAQQQPPPSGGWRRVGDPPPAPTQAQPQPPAPNGQNPEPVDRSDADAQPPGQQPMQPTMQPPAMQQAPVQEPIQQPSTQPPPQRNDRPSYPPPYGVPARLTLQPGTYVTVRINQALSTDHNQPGDPFNATLMQPLVVNGVVVAQAGQSVYGRVTEVQKQHSDRPSRLGIELTGLTLVDGTQVPIRSQVVARRGGTTPAGVQAGTVAATTGIGAAVGAAADWGRGAAIGAGAGAAAGIIGVLLTRNHPTVVYPETALTFDLTAPVEISTVNAPQAFRYVGPQDYQRQQAIQARPVGPYPGYRPPAAYYYGPGYYPYYPYPYYGLGWGPGFAWGWGPGFYFRGGYWRR